MYIEIGMTHAWMMSVNDERSIAIKNSGMIEALNDYDLVKIKEILDKSPEILYYMPEVWMYAYGSSLWAKYLIYIYPVLLLYLLGRQVPTE